MLEALRNAFRPEQDEYVLPVEDEVSSVEQERWVKDIGNSKQRPKRSMTEDMNDLLGLLKSAEGQVVRDKQLAEVMGFKSGSSISRLITELRRRKAVTRKGKRGSFTYRVNRDTVNRRPYKRRVETSVVQPSGQARKVAKPSYVARKDPRAGEVTEFQKRFLRYMENHQGVPISQNQIAEDLGMATGSVYHALHITRRNGLLERLAVTKRGSVYRVVGESTDSEAKQGPNLSATSDDEAPETTVTNEAQLFSVIESLSWEYMKKHWNTNMLQFLTWLKQQKFKR